MDSKSPNPNTLRRIARWLALLFVPNVGTIALVLVLLYAQSVGAFPLGTASSTTTISYQGRLADSGGNPVNTSVGMTFRIYNLPTGGSPSWTEVYASVPVSDGLFHVLLGSSTPIPNSLFRDNNTLYLGIAVGGDAEMTPREQLASAPYAMTVSDGGITTAKIADKAVTASKMDLSGTRLAVNSISDFTMTSDSFQEIPGLTLTAPEPGIYLIMIHVKVLSSAAHSYRYAVAPMIDGAVIYGTDTTYGGGAGEESSVMIVHDAALNAGSVVKVLIHSVAGGQQTVIGQYTSMRMIRLSDKP